MILAKCKLYSIKLLISKALIDSNISHDTFVLINNVLKEHENIKEEIKNCRKNTESKNPKVVKTKNGRIMLSSKCEVCDSKQSNFIQ